MERQIIVPTIGPAEFGVSPLLLGYRAAPLPAAPRQIKPFRVGDVQISCQPGRTYARGETLAVFFQVFNAPEELRRAGRADFVFERQGQEFMRSEVPLEGLAETGVIREFPLQAFLPDHYKLRVSLVDSRNQTVVSTEADLEVSPLAEIPRPWVIAKVMPPADNAMYSYLVGGQLVKAGDLEGGGALLAKAYHANPGMLDFALAYAERLIASKDFAGAGEVLKPFAESAGERNEVLALLGACSESMGQHRQAVLYYRAYLDRAGMRLDILNSLGECLYQLRDLEGARAAWERSLAIDPQQDRIREKLDRIIKRSLQDRASSEASLPRPSFPPTIDLSSTQRPVAA